MARKETWPRDAKPRHRLTAVAQRKKVTEHPTDFYEDIGGLRMHTSKEKDGRWTVMINEAGFTDRDLAIATMDCLTYTLRALDSEVRHLRGYKECHEDLVKAGKIERG